MCFHPLITDVPIDIISSVTSDTNDRTGSVKKAVWIDEGLLLIASCYLSMDLDDSNN